ncbi:predicted protein [Naegleria gruberi]|uniref:Protein phosphatase n=1 Tax=Naegleria gruberi TaxID=5762 RepID=D2VT56_NAEGR|nr:uncharacterized protein NAEGRDRAFT_52047 [Naegleria gruberi]EFC40025.1 predicted protein [Naegleria gruberi]|eukprot:XP_002672769.1 predicted protein [Naegleria gruberi strain NEG-M]
MDKGIAKSLNIGDSGFVIIRNGGIIYRSKPQQHRFNAPYQLTICPPERNGTCIQNEPKDGDLVEHQLADGDIIVMGTDGLFDNLFDWQILQIINQGQAGIEPFSEILKKAATGDKESILRVNQQLHNRAREIAKLARIVSISDSNFTFTPFSKAYTEETGRHISGGKKDDITVIVAALLKRKIFVDSFSKNQ